MTETPEQIATQVFGYLMAHPNRLAAFCTTTGLRISSLHHERMRHPFYIGLLDFVLANEADLAAFLADDGSRRADLVAAREQLDCGNPVKDPILAFQGAVDELESLARSLKANQRRARFRIVG